MNDLDKRIEKLKGVRIMLDGPYVGGIMPDGAKYNCPTWSTSDAKAFELVDELMDIGPGWSFHLDSAMLNREKLKDSGFKIAERAENWNCSFMHGLAVCMGGGKKRPEAICRAYIAAREWMATKGEA